MTTYKVIVSGILEEYIAKAIKKGLEGPDVPDSIKIEIIEVPDEPPAPTETSTDPYTWESGE